jgi:hypothetical protein
LGLVERLQHTGRQHVVTVRPLTGDCRRGILYRSRPNRLSFNAFDTGDVCVNFMFLSHFGFIQMILSEKQIVIAVFE